jgi:phosphatidylserine decarboxylase
VDQAAAHVTGLPAGSESRLRIPIAREGWPFVLAPAAIAGLLGAMGRRGPALAFGLAAAAFAGFFRDPDRSAPHVPGALLAPADGKVMDVAFVEDEWVGPAVRVSIFLSPLDVHVNRSPLEALVRDVQWERGGFLPAYRSEASEVNERCTLLLESGDARVAVSQIAGVVARRIVCRAQPGDTLAAGERFGLIRFGSRTDLVAPREADVRVAAGDRVRGGETIVVVLAGKGAA